MKKTHKSTISYAGKKYPSITSLYHDWKSTKPSEKTFGIKLQRWRKKNPTIELNDEIIQQLFRTRSSIHSLTFQGKIFAGPKELYRNFKGEKITFGGFWNRLNEFKTKYPGTIPSDCDIESMLRQNLMHYKGLHYKSYADIYKAIKGHKIVIHRFVDNVSSWRNKNPQMLINDDVLEKCCWFYEGAHFCSYKEVSYPSLKALYDFQQEPKCKWVTFQNRFRKLKELKEITDDDIRLLLQQKAKIGFFKGIMYRWTHLQSGKNYIGISSQALKERIRLHLRQAKSGNFANPLSLQAAIAIHGLEAFTVEVVAEFVDEEAMKIAEEQAVKAYDCLAPNGYNLQEGGRSWTKQGKDVEFEGKIYPSYSSLALAFNISEKLLDGRRRLGWGLDHALKTPVFARNSSKKPVKVNGIEYQSIKDATKAFNKSPAYVYSKLDLGWSIEDALGLTNRNLATRKVVVVNGVQFPTISAAARFFGKNPREVFWKIQRGKTLEHALNID